MVRYFLKRLEWKIRKFLGLRKKRVKTLDDVQLYGQDFLMKLIILAFVIIVLMEIGKGLALLWRWFFPHVPRYPVTPL